MASKRGLYKPATLQDVGSKEQRRGLAQGRLVNKPILPDTMTVFASPRDINMNSFDTETGDLSVTIPHSGYPLQGTTTPPRQVMASVMTRNSNRLTPQDVTNSGTPRKSPFGIVGKHPSPPTSPSKPTPSASLELSDTERDLYYTRSKSQVKHVRHHTPSPVLLVDASGGRLDPDRSEVMTSTDFVTSPAKVICHAPAVVASDLRDTGYTQETAKIRVDPVPTVSLLGDLDMTQVNEGGESTKHGVGGSHGGARTPLVVKENTMAGVSRGRAPSIGRDSSRGEENTSVNSAKSDSVIKKKKKTKATGIVPSRYMQSASKSVHSTSVGESSSVPPRPRVSSTALPSRFGLAKKASQKSHTKRTVSTSVMQQAPTANQKPLRAQTNQSQYSYTPMARGTRRGGGITSTPAVDESMIANNWDASAIGASMIQGPDVSMGMAPSGDVSVFHSNLSHSAGQDSAYVSLPTHKKKRHPDISQDYLDRVYGRYLQAVFIDSKLEKTLKEQEKESMSQIYGLWHENERMRTKKRNLEMELKSARHANNLDHHLDVQISGVSPVVAHLSQLKQQYSTLAHALDTTRHQLGVTGIHVPQDEDNFHESLLSALAESEHLLGEISVVTRAHQPQVSSFSSAIQALQKAVENEDKELKRCQEMLSATCTLATQESSLRIQDIEH
ncbi:uncharacterized protein LOC117295103 isoform X1 [Asterias rubens]|uniref:uncharacterized protein LOC117295103 isoform X1 n=1 Tax=Asterias rubens TaxID=7604 RepID=UPI001455CAF0|nr:uncharacterized protein LOC117295103 isoform X1 [Asterias rubens]